MIDVRWSAAAFAVLESLPSKIAFEILESTDRLVIFPEMGVALDKPYSNFGDCRQLVFRRKYRLVYLYETVENEVRILMLQRCRQKLATMAELRRSKDEPEPGIRQ